MKQVSVRPLDELDRKLLAHLQHDARVTSVGAGTGAEFSILPPQNATGNWVKIVQRVPLRLRIASEEDVSALRAGMSVDVDIDTGHQTTLGAVLARARP